MRRDTQHKWFNHPYFDVNSINETLPPYWQNLDLMDFYSNSSLTMALYRHISEDALKWLNRMAEFAKHQVGTPTPLLNVPLLAVPPLAHQSIEHFVQNFVGYIVEEFFIGTDASFHNSALFTIDMSIDSRSFEASIHQMIDQFEELQVVSISEHQVVFQVHSTNGIIGEITVLKRKLYEKVLNPQVGISALELLKLQKQNSGEVALVLTMAGDLLVRQGLETSVHYAHGELPLIHTHPPREDIPSIFPSAETSWGGDIAVVKAAGNTQAIIHEYGITIYQPNTDVTIEFGQTRDDARIIVTNIHMIPTLNARFAVDPNTAALLVFPNSSETLPFIPIERALFTKQGLPPALSQLGPLFP